MAIFRHFFICIVMYGAVCSSDEEPTEDPSWIPPNFYGTYCFRWDNFKRPLTGVVYLQFTTKEVSLIDFNLTYFRPAGRGIQRTAVRDVPFIFYDRGVSLGVQLNLTESSRKSMRSLITSTGLDKVLLPHMFEDETKVLKAFSSYGHWYLSFVFVHFFSLQAWKKDLSYCDTYF
ncbi:hypothetical protein FOL47_004968 [Perkinsus chesapeaki]|uniref:Uncharacterized protein n=1 Tax=Perkinsus chesapeaki TaxID=330153 RepID=A0A7J6MZM4_PERCH|nr:hypothetical protein FOL47_004968 [Perkinsus chesapeaki]